jgi:hypothetical protein
VDTKQPLRRTSTVRKPLASRDANKLPVRKPSWKKVLILGEGRLEGEETKALVKVHSQDIVPFDETKTLEELDHDYRVQQHQLELLQLELSDYKSETNKVMETHLFDRFEGIKKNEVMTQFACKWFGILMIAHAFFFYCYFILRKGSPAFAGAKHQAVDGILQVSIYSFSYIFIVLFDIFWLTVCPDRVRCERTTAHTHVIVAAHRAHASLEVMLPTVLRTFAPECIWVADNGFRDKDAEALCARLGLNYEYNQVGNKANAIVVVARKIKRRHGDAVKNGKKNRKLGIP